MQTLFTVETPRLRLTWSGPPALRRGASPLVVAGTGAGRARLNGAPTTEADVWLEEETAYSVLVQSLDGAVVGLRHRDPVVTAGLVSADDGRVLHGRVGFGSQAGRSQFELTVGSTREVEVAVSVLPTKLVEAEVAAMRAEVEAFAAGLAVASVRPATLAGAAGDRAPSVPVWLSALARSVGRLESAVAQINQRPVLDVRRHLDSVRPGRVRRPSTETRRAVLRSGVDVEGLPARPGSLSFDTDAHRWLFSRLGMIDRAMSRVLRGEIGRRPTSRRQVLVAEVSALSERVGRLRRAGVFRAVGGRAPAVPPLVLRRRPGYAQAYVAIREVERGLDLQAGDLAVTTRDLSVLFETWAALTAVRLLGDVLGAEVPARPFGVDVRGADVRLRSGRRWAARLDGRGVRADVIYTPRFPAPPGLLAQRPDLLLVLRRGTSETRVVLDAKYRRDDSARYRRRYGAAGPPEDALNTMHRYRDAVPGVSVAAAVFPGPSDGFEASRLWTSLGTLGVGAIPLRPGDVSMLARFLRGLVGP